MYVHIARQPIFNVHKQLFAYELLFRQTLGLKLGELSGERATSSLLSTSFLTEDIDRITGNQDARNIQLEGDRSRAEDMDLVKGLSDFQQTQLGYQAALQTYASVQKMSLFNYIS